MLGSAVSCQQAEELTPTLAKSDTNSNYLTEDGLYDVNVDTEKKTATINYLTDKNEDKTTVTIPSTVTYQGVTYSVTGLGGVYLNANNTVTSITLPDRLETIGAECFKEMQIEEIKIPESVKSIGDKAFRSCKNLKAVNIPSKISEIPNFAFQNCSSLQYIELPEGLITIGQYAFSDSGLSEVKFPSTLKIIGYYAFQCTKVESIILPDSLICLSGNSFTGCEKLTSVVIPSNMETIYQNALSGCTNLSKVTIGSGVTKIEGGAFLGSSKLSTLYCYAKNPPTLNSNAFTTTAYNTCILYVPKESLESYKSNDSWKKFQRIESITSDETPDTEEQKADLTDATTEMPEGTYAAGNLTYSRTVSNFKQGIYATLCLPFSINLAEAECFSDVYIPNEIALYNTTTKKLTLMMSKASNTAIISAGQPFMAKLNSSTISLKNYNRTYLRSTAAEDLKSNMEKKFKVYNYDGTSTVLLSNDDIDVRFCGTFSQMTDLNKDNYKTFATTGMFYQATMVNPFRAYIYKSTTTEANSLQSLTVGSDAVTDAILQGNFTINRNQLIINK